MTYEEALKCLLKQVPVRAVNYKEVLYICRIDRNHIDESNVCVANTKGVINWVHIEDVTKHESCLDDFPSPHPCASHPPELLYWRKKYEKELLKIERIYDI